MFCVLAPLPENRLKRLKGQSGDVTSRDMLKSLSQAKKECWDRFLHDTHTSELFQSGDLDEGCVSLIVIILSIHPSSFRLSGAGSRRQ